jgi:ubiquinone/menaquinone biosynthesis C-methylase UbiE
MSFLSPEHIVEQCGVQTGMRIADFGSGAGRLAVALAERVGSSGAVYCIDIQKELLTKALHFAHEKHVDTLVFLHGDLERPRGSTLEAECVDMVFVTNLLFQIEKKHAVFMEAFRVLKKKGVLVVVDWSDSFGGVGPEKEHVFPESSAKVEAHEAGFRFVREILAGAYHYGCLFSKP